MSGRSALNRGEIIQSIMNSGNRPEKTTAQLVALICQRRVDWWPIDFSLTISRSAEHDWVAIVDLETLNVDEKRQSDFSRSLGQVVAELRVRNAWVGR